MKKTINDFTPEIRQKIAEYKIRATKNLYNGTEHKEWKREDTVAYIEEIYRLAKQPHKPVVIVADSPIKYRAYYNLLFKIKNERCTNLVNYAWAIKNSIPKPNLKTELGSELSSELSRELVSKLRSELSGELSIELNNELYRELYRELNNELHNELGSELYNELRRELYRELNRELDSELHSELHRELRRELYRELDRELHSELHSELDSELYNAPVSHNIFLTSESARVYLMWYKFIKDEFKIKTTKEKELDWLYENINKANISKTYFTKKVVLVLRMPQSIIRNSTGINNVEGPAIIYPDQKLYYVSGLKVDKKLFDRLSNKEYLFEEWIAESNEEIKSAVLSFYQQKFGDEYVFQFLSENMKEVDTYVDKKPQEYLNGTTKGMNIGVYTLYKGHINNIEIAYVRCYCPSTDRMFFLGVNPSHTNAKDAIASLYSIPKKLVNEITCIQRQGEIFSTNFTENGLKLLKNMNSEEIADVVSISGDKYFDLIKYEY